MSLWQIAQAAVLISTSPAPGSASSTVSIAKGAPKARQTAALVFMREIRSKSAAHEAVSPAREAKVQAQSCGGREQFWGAWSAAGRRRKPLIALRRRLKGVRALLSALEHFQAFR